MGPVPGGTLSGMTTIHVESRPTSRSELAAWYESVLENQVRQELGLDSD